jgi:hypothetical protein
MEPRQEDIERASMWIMDPPPLDEDWHRRVYDINKDIVDDLRRSVVVVGRLTAKTLYRDLTGDRRSHKAGKPTL